jgi:hypothetical protein
MAEEQALRGDTLWQSATDRTRGMQISASGLKRPNVVIDRALPRVAAYRRCVATGWCAICVARLAEQNQRLGATDPVRYYPGGVKILPTVPGETVWRATFTNDVRF